MFHHLDCILCFVQVYSDCVEELFYDRGHHHEFLSLSQELAAPGEMRQAQPYDFNFKNVEKQFESYQGINVKLRCVLWILGRLNSECLVVNGFIDTLFVCRYHGEWRMCRRRRTYGYTHSACRPTAIIR